MGIDSAAYSSGNGKPGASPSSPGGLACGKSLTDRRIGAALSGIIDRYVPDRMRTTYRKLARDGACGSEHENERCSGRLTALSAKSLHVIAVTALLAGALWLLPGRDAIPPLVESDYAYLLTAAERFSQGLGLTAPVPVAPHQPWEWRCDWAFLTRWPIGYPLLVAGVRLAADVSILQAAAILGVLACAVAMTGWFLLVRRCLPRGAAGGLLALLTAMYAVSPPLLLNPSTDLLVVAALPWILLIASRPRRRDKPRAYDRSPAESSRLGVETDASEAFIRSGRGWSGYARVAGTGLLAGSLFWIRYAAVFIPAGLVACTAMQYLRRRRSSRSLKVLAVSSAVPVVLLLLINRSFGLPESLQSQLNLGHSVRFAFTADLFAQAWRRFTDLGFYDHHPFTRWVYALLPMGIAVAALLSRRARKRLKAYYDAPPVLTSAVVALCGLAMLIAATALFGDKYPYATLPRYYLPIKPLYFVLFVGPLLLVPRRLVRVAAIGAMLVGCSWVIGRDWYRPYRRFLGQPREAAPSGRWAKAFTPNASPFYERLRRMGGDDLILVSNYHEFVTFETGLPALPIPPDRKTFDRWIDRIRRRRGIDRPRVVFALDPDNRWRSYWIPDPSDIVQRFDLKPITDAGGEPIPYLYRYDSGTVRTARRAGCGNRRNVLRASDSALEGSFRVEDESLSHLSSCALTRTARRSRLCSAFPDRIRRRCVEARPYRGA